MKTKISNNDIQNPNRANCDFLRNQDECACPAKIKNLNSKAPLLYKKGWRRVGGDVCIFVQDNSFEQCPYRLINGKEV